MYTLATKVGSEHAEAEWVGKDTRYTGTQYIWHWTTRLAEALRFARLSDVIAWIAKDAKQASHLDVYEVEVIPPKPQTMEYRVVRKLP
jgi:hypothetical protein